MANLGGVFDANAKENQAPSNVVPKGDYEFIAVKSEKKRTKDGSGEYLSFQFQITKGEFQNRMVFQNFNLWLTPSATDPEKAEKTKTAIAIAKGNFSKFCRAVGVLTPQDSSELHNRPFIGKVKVRASEGYEEQNEIYDFSPKLQNAPLVQPSTSAGASW